MRCRRSNFLVLPGWPKSSRFSVVRRSGTGAGGHGDRGAEGVHAGRDDAAAGELYTTLYTEPVHAFYGLLYEFVTAPDFSLPPPPPAPESSEEEGCRAGEMSAIASGDAVAEEGPTLVVEHPAGEGEGYADVENVPSISDVC